MDAPHPGDLVTVTEGDAHLDGIVFDAPSHLKVVVAVADPARGPGLRTVHPDALSEREGEGAHDKVLRALLRRTPPPARAGHSGPGGGHGRAGHTRGAAHRPTGR